MTKLAIPEDTLASHTAVLGKAGSGKTFTIRGVVEWLLRKKRRACIIDPTGVWWGLRLDKDGKARGFDVVIFGGKHGDLPLNEAQGAHLAEIIGTSSTPVIIDTSQMTVGARTRFFTDFAETLLRKNSGPLHLVIDEAHLFAPQGRVADPQSGKMLHATNNLISLGRARGLRVTMITQRPAKLHKDSLTQAETLIALRLIAPQDRAAVDDWIGEWVGDKSQAGHDIADSLPSLPTGTGWVWAPVLHVLERVKFPAIDTFDSMKSPDDVDRKARTLPAIDLDKVGAQLKTVAEQAKANDPAALKARIAELERSATKTSTKAVDRPIVDHTLQKKAKALRGAVEAAMKILLEIKAQDFFKADAAGTVDQVQVQKAIEGALAAVGRTVEANLKQRNERIDRLQRQAEKVIEQLKAAVNEDVTVSVAVRHNEPFTVSPAALGRGLKSLTADADKAQAPVALAPRAREANGALPVGERATLGAIIQLHGGRGVTREHLTVVTGYKKTSRNTYLQRLQAKGLIVSDGDLIQATAEGRAALPDLPDLPTGDALRQHYLRTLPTGESSVLQTVLSVYPQSIDRDLISERTGYTKTSRNTYIQRLGARGLIVAESGGVRAHADLFE